MYDLKQSCLLSSHFSELKYNIWTQPHFVMPGVNYMAHSVKIKYQHQNQNVQDLIFLLHYSHRIVKPRAIFVVFFFKSHSGFYKSIFLCLFLLFVRLLHFLTQKYIHCNSTHVIVDVKFFPRFFAKLFNQLATFFVKYRHERF